MCLSENSPFKDSYFNANAIYHYIAVAVKNTQITKMYLRYHDDNVNNPISMHLKQAIP